MRRRALLASVGALSAGCLGLSPRQTGTATSTPVNDQTPPSTATQMCSRTSESSGTKSPDETAGTGDYRLTGLDESAGVDLPSDDYALVPTAFYTEADVEQKAAETDEKQVVRDITDVGDDEVRAAIETVVDSKNWRSNTLPDGLAETVEHVDFFTGVLEHDTYTHVALTLYRFQREDLPVVEFSATIADDVVSADSPGVVEFGLTNRSNTTKQVASGTVAPFGMVSAESLESSDEFLLWRDYEREGCIDFHEGEWIRCLETIETELSPRQDITRRYEVLPCTTSHYPQHTVPPGPGTYRFTDSVEYYEHLRQPKSKLAFEVQFSLESL